MNKITPSVNPNKLMPKLVALGSYEVYLAQVKATLDAIRFDNNGMSYVPAQMGGLTGQRKIIGKSLVLQTIDFEVN